MNATTDSLTEADGAEDAPIERSEAEVAAADAAYEQELVRLLFRLEYERGRMQALDNSRPVQVLDGVRRLRTS